MTNNAICPFCGQSFMMSAEKTEKEAVEFAVEWCDCLQAREFRRKVQYIAEAKDKLREIFNYRFIDGKETACCDSDSELLEILNAAIEHLADFKIKQITMAIPGIGKIVLNVDGDGKIKIKRSMTFSYESKV